MRVVDGRGKILPDCFAETRLVNLPPAVTAVSTYTNTSTSIFALWEPNCSFAYPPQLIICFNRNHNVRTEQLWPRRETHLSS